MSNKVRQLTLSLAGVVLLIMSLVLNLVPDSEALVSRETAPAQIRQAPSPAASMEQLVEATGGLARISISRATGVARFVRLPPGSLALPVDGEAQPQEKAMTFFRAYGGVFGIMDPEAELLLEDVTTDNLSTTRVAYQQVYQGIPVFGGVLYAHFDRGGALIAVNGAFVPNIKVNEYPVLAEADAAGIAINELAARQVGASAAARLQAVNNKLLIFRTGLAEGVAGVSHLAYQVEVRDQAGSVREFVYVDAHNGKLLDQISGTHQALDRQIYLQALNPANLVWKEGDPLPYTGTSQVGVNRLIDYAEDTYLLFYHISGGSYDSYDGSGTAIMRSVYDDPDIQCPNALWNGVSTNYCVGVDGDDTVAHEWTHAYSEYTHNLIYQWQPGALSESYSDIFGEIVDLINGDGTDVPGGMRTAGACSVYTPGVAGTDNSYRWLSGEDDSGFGGALRDMWTPSCYNHPEKVLDDNYACSGDDFGGVHTNSGVPNRAFTLLVDGGLHNGVTVTQIGLTKTAAIYWRSMSVYQNQTTDFAAHADAVEQSCTDLIGQNIYDPATGLVSPQQIVMADCLQVANAMQAVEMRQDPAAQCGFQPLLENPPPPLCSGEIGPASQVYSATFESGISGWTVDTDVAFAAVEPLTWVLTNTLPTGRVGTAFFALNEQGGSCSSSDQDPEDDSRAMHLNSPPITIPNGTTHPRITFWHWLATEEGFDGGNVKIRVNGGPWQLIAGQYYVFNAYNSSLQTVSQGNTNPLASQEAFTGADGGRVLGSWGQSQVNVSAYARPGDTIQLRFDFGSDGCTGLFGWYVDDVEIYYCRDREVFLPVTRRD